MNEYKKNLRPQLYFFLYVPLFLTDKDGWQMLALNPATFIAVNTTAITKKVSQRKSQKRRNNHVVDKTNLFQRVYNL